jgi:hypothetical protein
MAPFRTQHLDSFMEKNRRVARPGGNGPVGQNLSIQLPLSSRRTYHMEYPKIEQRLRTKVFESLSVSKEFANEDSTMAVT